jgi:hypothetical protein
MNYTQLLAAIADLIHRSDLSSAIPGFVMITEAKLNRYLRVRQMETVLPETPIASNVIALDPGIADVKLLWLPGYEGAPLKRQALDAVVASGTQGTATMYARRGGSDLYFNGTGNVQGVLYEKIPALSDSNLTNWLLDEHPDVYLYGALVEAAIYIKDDPTVYAAQYQGALNEVGANEQRYTGPLVARAR